MRNYNERIENFNINRYNNNLLIINNMNKHLNILKEHHLLNNKIQIVLNNYYKNLVLIIIKLNQRVIKLWHVQEEKIILIYLVMIVILLYKGLKIKFEIYHLVKNIHFYTNENKLNNNYNLMMIN